MKTPSRRSLLGLIAGGVVMAGGCLGDLSSDDGSTDDESSSSGEHPTSRGSDSDELPPCPSSNGDERIVCYDEHDPEADQAVLVPSARTVAEGEAIDFTLENHADHALSTNFYDWRLEKYVEGEWYHVAPLFTNDPLMAVEPNHEHTWTVTVDNDGIESGEPLTHASGTESLTVGGLGGGNYAFGTSGWFDDDTDDSYRFVATFAIEGEDIAVTPTDSIVDTRVEADDGSEALVAESSRGEADGDHRLGAYELVVVDDPGGNVDRRIITEQLLRNDQLRDVVALAHEYDVDAVSLEEYSASVPVFGAREDGVFEYQDRYYRIETNELEE